MKKSAVWLREDFVNFEWVVIFSHFCRSEMIRETTSTHFLTVKKKHAHSIYVVVQIYLWLNIFQLSLIFYSKLIKKRTKKFKPQDTWFALCTQYLVDCWWHKNFMVYFNLSQMGLFYSLAVCRKMVYKNQCSSHSF